ncbi:MULTISPECIES: hypothetical protein [Pyrobaculum]|uniref:Uncharacterized protein n=2 Tax=Pyrobaculum arsenaticum TaxID=121277 RepID=A4WHJ3_PYRAR|nr:hypothetical protein [Pyrobaculum arsenaticum]ABP49860.1 hypothetical protein Pars_0246 [Pyrobaculum arsenaticum DSM 13514]NYR15846.1 hypothetical protein [Pyrobaculum arsenaticum]
MIDESLKGRRVLLIIASCNQLEESQLRKVEGLVLYVSRDKVGVQTDDKVEVVDKGWIVSVKVLD